MAVTSVTTSLSRVGEPNVSANTSVVRQTVTVSWNYGTWQSSGATVKFSITTGSGTTSTWSMSTGFNTSATTSGSQSFSHDFTIYHKADGSQTVSAVGSFTWTTGSSPGTKTGTASYTAPTIPRATTPTLPSGITLGDTLTVDLSSRASSSFSHTVYCNWYGNWITLAEKTASTKVTYKPPDSWANNFPNQRTTNGTIITDTYSGSSLVGRTQKAFNVTVPNSMSPSVTAVLTNTNNTFGAYCTNLSAVHTETTATGQYSATITSYGLTVDGTLYAGKTATSNILTNPGIANITVTAVDSRGLTGTATYPITVTAYNKPSLSTLSVHRCTQNGAADDSGSYITLSGYGTITDIDDNTGTMTVKYRAVGASDWTTVDAQTQNDAGKVTVSAIFPANDTLAYDVYTSLEDKATIDSATTTISPGYATMDWRAGGKGVAFGTTATRDGLGIDMPLYGSGILDYVYPVGSVYMSFNSANPAELFGGTWEQIQGKMLIAVGSTGQWAWLCDENQTFTLTQTEKVRYGVPENWVYKTLTAGTYAANTATFGSDPAQGFAKSVQHTLSPKVGEQGGEVEHRLRTYELPQHSHNTNQWMVSSVNNFTGYGVSISSKTNASGIFATDNAQGNTNGRATTTVGYNWTHNNMPPYLAVYMWRRTA